MPLFTDTPVRPNQQNQAGATDALTITEFTGMVEGTIERKSKLDPFIKRRRVKGTNSLTNYAVGETQLQALQPGVAPDGTLVDFSKNMITIDTVVLARNIFPLLEVWQNNFDVRKQVSNEQGKKIAKFTDQAFMIAGVKVALLTQSTFSGGVNGKPLGHFGGSQVELDQAGDEIDPAALYKAIADLFVQMEGKDVEPMSDDIILIVRPAQFYALQQAEQIINGEYLTSDGNRLTNVPIFKAYGVPVISSNNLPNGVITNHLLSNTNNGMAYDGDFSDVVALAIAPQALMAGETISLTTEVFWDQLSKQWFVDSYLSFAVTGNRAEYAGVITKYHA
jgi:major capsid protein